MKRGGSGDVDKGNSMLSRTAPRIIRAVTEALMNNNCGYWKPSIALSLVLVFINATALADTLAPSPHDTVSALAKGLAARTEATFVEGGKLEPIALTGIIRWRSGIRFGIRGPIDLEATNANRAKRKEATPGALTFDPEDWEYRKGDASQPPFPDIIRGIQELLPPNISFKLGEASEQRPWNFSLASREHDLVESELLMPPKTTRMAFEHKQDSKRYRYLSQVYVGGDYDNPRVALASDAPMQCEVTAVIRDNEIAYADVRLVYSSPDDSNQLPSFVGAWRFTEPCVLAGLGVQPARIPPTLRTNPRVVLELLYSRFVLPGMSEEEAKQGLLKALERN